MAAAAALASCTQNAGTLGFASAKNLDMNYPGGYNTSTVAAVKGTDSRSVIFGFPTGTPSASAAIEDAMEKAGPNCVGLRNVKVKTGFYTLWIYGSTWFSAKGTPVYKK